MKKTILFILLLMIGGHLSAQQADYYTANLDAYVGAWEYSNGTEIFRIVLKKGNRYWPNGSLRSEQVYGGHYYQKAGQVIADYTQGVAVSTQWDYGTMSITANNGRLNAAEVNPNELSMGFTDNLHDKSGYGTLTLLPGNPARLHWKIEGMFEVVIFPIPGEPLPVILPGWSVPVDVVLTKVPE